MAESARIASLETQVRTLKRMLFGVFGLVVAGAVLGATSLQTVPGVIKAKRFEVVHDGGNPVVILESWGTSGVARFKSAVKGDKSPGSIGDLVEISSNGDGGQLKVFSREGKPLMQTYGDKNGGSLVTYNRKAQPSVALLPSNTGGAVYAHDDSGELRATFGCPAARSGHALFINQENLGTLYLQSDSLGFNGASISVLDKNGKNARSYHSESIVP